LDVIAASSLKTLNLSLLLWGVVHKLFRLSVGLSQLVFHAAFADSLPKLKAGLHATGEAFEEICHGLPLI
jgi:hypothetical protein